MGKQKTLRKYTESNILCIDYGQNLNTNIQQQKRRKMKEKYLRAHRVTRQMIINHEVPNYDDDDDDDNGDDDDNSDNVKKIEIEVEMMR